MDSKPTSPTNSTPLALIWSIYTPGKFFKTAKSIIVTGPSAVSSSILVISPSCKECRKPNTRCLLPPNACASQVAATSNPQTSLLPAMPYLKSAVSKPFTAESSPKQISPANVELQYLGRKLPRIFTVVLREPSAKPSALETIASKSLESSNPKARPASEAPVSIVTHTHLIHPSAVSCPQTNSTHSISSLSQTPT